jgi:uncharacterized protein DUF6927
MGWTSYYREPGQSDLEHLRGALFDGETRYELLDGATVEHVFYGAVRSPDGTVWGLVVLQHRNRGRSRYDNSNYARKEMEDRSGPFVYRCPARILDLLSPLPSCEHQETYCVHCLREIKPDGERWVSEAKPGQVAEVAGPRCYSGYPVGANENGGPPLHAPGGLPPCGTCSARAWREHCRAVLADRAAQPPLHAGDTFTVAEPWTFRDGVTESTFTLLDGRRRTFQRASDGRTVRLPARHRWPRYELT